MRKCFFLLFLATFSTLCLFAQQPISGVVVDENKEPIIGVSVVVKGSSTGTITDIDGKYQLNSVPSGATLLFSFVGMKSQEVKLSPTAKTLNITMQSSSLAIEEVVVTAMGIKQEKKRLNFAVQSVNTDDLNDNKSANFVNALQGKVAGINITHAGGSPNSGASVILRGIASVNPGRSNQPLYVLNGIAMQGGPEDINPNDIENVTILKGAAASALYGQDAANGVIMITTKQGSPGKMSVNANVSLQTEHTANLPETQKTYGVGALGVYRPEQLGGTSTAWGAPLPSDIQRYDNIRNFFQTGFYQKYDVSISGGSEKLQVYTSAGYSNHDGTVPRDYRRTLSLLFRSDYKVNDKLSISAGLSSTSHNFRSSGETRAIYYWPISDDLRNYEEENGWPRFRYIRQGDKFVKKSSPVSPLWSRYKDAGENERIRNIFQASVLFTPIEKLRITARINKDDKYYNYEGYRVPRFNILTQDVWPNFNANGAYAEGSPEYNEAYLKYYEAYNATPALNAQDLENIRGDNETREYLGAYSFNTSQSSQLSINGMIEYSIDLPKDITLELMLGSEAKMRNGLESSETRREFTIPNLYSRNSTFNDAKSMSSDMSHSAHRIAGVFGELRLDYKGLANLSATYRSDWSSTIFPEKNPYSYPSVTVGLIFSELFDWNNDWFSYGKLRGNWAVVGSDAQPNLFSPRYSLYQTLPDGGYGVDPTKSVAAKDLTPEFADSWEIGFDLRFFENRTRLDLAYYGTTVFNQIATVRVSPASGYILQTRNEGYISNQGIEATLAQDIIKQRNFSWTTGLNFTLNRGRVEGLPDNIIELTAGQYEDIFPTAYLHGSTTALSGKDYLRTEDGRIIINEKGYPQINPTKGVVIGNREPDFMLGITSNFKYQNAWLNLLIDARQGGDVANITKRGMYGSGQHKSLDTYRGRQIVWEGVVKQADGSYLPNTTPIVLNHQTINEFYRAVSSNFIEDGSYIRLSYVTLGYDFSSFLRKNAWIKSLKASLTGNNLFLLSRYTGSDPQINANVGRGGSGNSGIDNYAVPATRSFNFTLNATF